MTFYCLASPKHHPQTVALLTGACSARSLPYILIDPATFDYTTDARLQAGDLLYRVAAPRRANGQAHIIEKYLLSDQIATVYRSLVNSQFTYNASTIIHQYLIFLKRQLSFPKTILSAGTNRQLLANHVHYLGGFPVVAKTAHGSHGIGTMRIDSFPALFSLADFMAEHSHGLTLQQYIQTISSARVIVVGGQVVDSIEYIVPADDFRSNVGTTPRVRPRRFPASVNALAIAAVEALDLEAGGVDVLIDAAHHAYIAEVNTPFNFSRAQLISGVDIAGQLIDFLIAKSRRLSHA